MTRLFVALVAVSACTTEPPAGEPVVSRAVQLAVPIGISAELDLVLVIDDSAEMANLSAKVAGDVRAMMAAVEQVGSFDGLPDLRVGVLSTDLGSGGQLRGGDFLAERTRFPFVDERGFTGELADAVAPRAEVGVSGGAPRPFAVLGQALTELELRPEAYLAIVILTATDDAGAEDAAALATAIKATKADPSRVVVNAATACAPRTSPRVASLLAQFPNRSTQVSICDEDLTPLVTFDPLYRVTLGLPCLQAPPTEPRDCAASLVDPQSRAQVALPTCTDEAPDRCWSLMLTAQCPDGLPAVKLPRATFSAIATLECAVDD